MKRKDKKIFDKVIEELINMPNEEFMKLINEDREYEIADILVGGGFICVEKESPLSNVTAHTSGHLGHQLRRHSLRRTRKYASVIPPSFNPI